MPEVLSIAPSATRVLPQHPALWRGGDLARTAVPGVPTGFAALDRELPGGGWPVASLTEIMPAHQGIGELRLLGPALARLSRAGKPLFWIAPPYPPYAPALAAAGIDLARLTIVRTRTFQDTLWATEQALRANACGAVLAWTECATQPPQSQLTSQYTHLRRLQVAADGSQALVFLFRAPRAACEISPAALRLLLDTDRGGLAITIAKRRGAPLTRPLLIPTLGSPGAGQHRASPIDTKRSHALARRLPAASAA